MSLKATCIDENRTIHLLIALNRDDVNMLIEGKRLNFSVGSTLSPDSNVQIAFGETDEDLIAALPEPVDPGMGSRVDAAKQDQSRVQLNRCCSCRAVRCLKAPIGRTNYYVAGHITALLWCGPLCGAHRST